MILPEAAAPTAEPTVAGPDPAGAPAPGLAEPSAPEPAATAVEAPTPVPPAVAPIPDAALTDRVVQLINDARTREGLQPLSSAPALMEAARRQAFTIAEASRLSHTAPDGSPLESRVEAAGYEGWLALAEVLAAGPPSPEAAVAEWLASPEHRSHLLDPTLTDLGVGHHYQTGSTYGHWWVVELGRR